MASPSVTEARGVGYQIPRNTLALLMVAQAVVIVPHAAQLSPWIIGVALLCGLWRTLVYQGRWDFPKLWVKALLVVASSMAIGVSALAGFSLETAASLLIVAFALKLVEMKSRRDAYLVAFLCYFVIAMEFLFSQTMAVAAYGCLAVVVVTAALVSLNQLHSRVRPAASFRLAAMLSFQALPLTVLLFIFFPRVAPLWSVPLPAAASTGLSDTVSPGDIARLTQSGEVAFRVQFNSQRPLFADLYWRGLVFSEFSEGTWRVGDPVGRRPYARGITEAPQDADMYAGVRDYEVLLEPTTREWLYALDVPQAFTGRIFRTDDYRLMALDPVLSVFRYRVQSDSREVMDLTLAEGMRERELQLPPRDNPRMREFANALYARSGSTRAFAQALQLHIRTEPYVYTLSPPQLSTSNSIDQFWFDTRRGFCSHYAGAFVFAMRAVGIPARMVGGYQGGEFNPLSGHLVVRQYDAHAWTEVWIEGEGWVRFDPTAAVAPSRIEQGLAAALPEEERSRLGTRGMFGLADSGLFDAFTDWADSLEHRWNLWVVGYDTQLQKNLLTSLLGKITPARIGMAMLFGGALSIGLVAIVLFWRRREIHRDPVEKLFATFARKMQGVGLPRAAHETPVAYLTRIGVARPRLQPQLDVIGAEMQRFLYDPEATYSRQDLWRLRSALQRVRFAAAFTAN